MDNGISVGEQIICDAEFTAKNENLILSVDGNHYFENANQRTKEESFSGEYSVKVENPHPYGFSFRLNNVQPDDYFEVSVWKKGKTEDGVLIAQTKNAKDFYAGEWNPVQRSDNGWEKISLELNIPPDFTDNYVLIYAWNKGEDPIYFDDIIIKRKAEKIYPDYEKDVFRMFIDTTGIIKLRSKRLTAFNNGVLESSDMDWVDALIFDGDSVLRAETRLKGDWLDHLYGEKWSFRIKMKKDHVWNGLKTFSIHTPSSRDFMNEWFLHKLFDKEDVLSTRYDFIPLELNGKSLGIYAYEEHFEKQLVEANKRREGPILKLSEEFFWIIQRLNKSKGINAFLPYFDASEIIPFKIGRTLSDSMLRSQFFVAQNLVNQFKNRKAKMSEIFDVEPLAKYMALVDLTRGYHGLAWHNLRFYYNPIISKLELVGFDCFSSGDIIDIGENAILGQRFLNPPRENARNEELLLYQMFSDPVIIKKYQFYLAKYSDEDYLQEIFNEFDKEIISKESIIKKEFLFYSFNREAINISAGEIREDLPEYILNSQMQRVIVDPVGEKLINYDSLYRLEFVPAMIKAHKIGERNGLNDVRVINYFPGTISIIGAGQKNNSIDNKFILPVKAGSYNTKDYISEIFNTDTISKYIYFKVDGYNQAFYTSISDWPIPGVFNPRQELMNDMDFELLPFCRLIDSTVIFPEGRYTVETTIMIPKGYKIIFEPGCELDFINGTCLISSSPLTMQGLDNKKIVFRSSDNSAMGVNVFQADGISIVKNVEFYGFNTLDYKGWTLTGAVNFYESDVDISNTLFKNNNCEDALNIIRSDFSISNCNFENIYGDAFDSDYSMGQVTETNFIAIGNDAMDFSTSEVEIMDCIIDNAGDKGISSGEKSIVKVSNTIITNSNIGIASKDLSEIFLDKINVSDCNYGFVGFIKKPEFGPSKIITSETECTNVRTLFLIELGSEINFNGNITKGHEVNIADKLYQDEK